MHSTGFSPETWHEWAMALAPVRRYLDMRGSVWSGSRAGRDVGALLGGLRVGRQIPDESVRPGCVSVGR